MDEVPSEAETIYTLDLNPPEEEPELQYAGLKLLFQAEIQLLDNPRLGIRQLTNPVLTYQAAAIYEPEQLYIINPLGSLKLEAYSHMVVPIPPVILRATKSDPPGFGPPAKIRKSYVLKLIKFCTKK